MRNQAYLAWLQPFSETSASGVVEICPFQIIQASTGSRLDKLSSMFIH